MMAKRGILALYYIYENKRGASEVSATNGKVQATW